MDEKVKRKAVIQWVPLEKMRVRAEVSQRAFDPAWANEIARNFDIDRFRRPVVNRSGEWFWIVDGQHSTDGYKQWLGDWKDQKVECEVYHGLTEKEEADLFDWLNNTKPVSAFDKFTTRITAEREEETNIAAIVRLRGLKIARKRSEGAISCVSALRRVYRRGPEVLDRTLEIVAGAYGDSGLEADVICGVGLLISRYDRLVVPGKAISALSSARGGVGALRNRRERLRQQTGVQSDQCTAAAAVEIINRGKGGKKLPSWWKSEAAQ